MVRAQRGEDGSKNQGGANKVTGETPDEMIEEEDNDEQGQLRYWTSEMCSRYPQLFDLVVTLGGDGTVLFASWLFQRIVPPILPFSLGSLGFLTNFDFNHYQDVLQNALDKGIRVNLRMRFTATVYRAELPATPSASRCRKRAIRSGKTGEILLREIREVGWNAIEGQEHAQGGFLDGVAAGSNGREDSFQVDENDEIAVKVKRRHKTQCLDCANSEAMANGPEGQNAGGAASASGSNGSRSSGKKKTRIGSSEAGSAATPAATAESVGRTSSKRSKKDKEVMCFTTRPAETFEILNDLVVDRGPSPYVSQLEVFGDEHHMTTVQADGLCISTPTGSTAYSLSAGGSLAHPEIPAILLTPICPHTLSFRPMLLPDSMELRIAVPYSSRSAAWASFDGRGRVELRQGDHIKVTASRYPFPTVCAEDQSIDWFQSISRTLKWNERQKQKSFVVLEDNDGDAADPPGTGGAEAGSGSRAGSGANRGKEHKMKRRQDSSTESASGGSVSGSAIEQIVSAASAAGRSQRADDEDSARSESGKVGQDEAEGDDTVGSIKQLPNGNGDPSFQRRASQSGPTAGPTRADNARRPRHDEGISTDDDGTEMERGTNQGDDDDEEESDDDEDDEDDDEDEREEEYDITDSSAVVTRANSPFSRHRHNSSYSSLSSEQYFQQQQQQSQPRRDPQGAGAGAGPGRSTYKEPWTSSCPSPSPADDEADGATRKQRHASSSASLSELASDLRRRSGTLSMSGSTNDSNNNGSGDAQQQARGNTGSGSADGNSSSSSSSTRKSTLGGLAGPSLSALKKLSPILRDTAEAGVRAAASAGPRAGPTMHHHPGMVRRLTAAVGGHLGKEEEEDEDGSHDRGRQGSAHGQQDLKASSRSSGYRSQRRRSEGGGDVAGGGGGGSNPGGGGPARPVSLSRGTNRQGAALVVYGDDSSDSDSVGDES
ncbi:hypothetical protein OC846_006774 [Tilletia horrida]|uniref:ATP-NAD kinase n=1 Tax=Tilletia horrida TaxID=155126 RepID=A0AAN6GI43_9BASI|nr:hypothetical protein OC845_006795 [Tilletia horrida]KAK0542309.1 hypothetical protein OC846_006774 [Tilletia horrida]KAK0558634.1 hypothetical protein OC861_006861 [Tilletia horrida]